MCQNLKNGMFSRPSNQNPFVPNPLRTRVIRNGITSSVLSKLVQHLNLVEVYDNSVSMSTTFIESDTLLRGLYMTRHEISDVFSAAVDKYLEFCSISHVSGVFRYFVPKRKVAPTVSYPIYKV